MTEPVEIAVRGQKLFLLPDRALFWERERLLVVADPHFGKAQVFRERGVPLPAGTTVSDLHRLSRLLDGLCPERVLFLGDLTHGRMRHPTEFEEQVLRWRGRHSRIEILLAAGNHDRSAGGPPPAFRLDRVDAEFVLEPFVFTHAPRPAGRRYGIAGHLHPAVTVSGWGRLKETLPCFCFSARGALLPAFGSFTGSRPIRPATGDRVFGIAGDEIVPMQEETGWEGKNGSSRTA